MGIDGKRSPKKKERKEGDDREKGIEKKTKGGGKRIEMSDGFVMGDGRGRGWGRI